MFLLQPINPSALDSAYDDLHGLCSDIKFLDNGMLLVTTNRIKKILDYYGDRYTRVAQVL